MMSGTQRRQELLRQMQHSSAPLAGAALAQAFQVSRQVIVQDVALLRAEGYDILSTNRGYLCHTPPGVKRVVRVFHSDDEILEELNTVVDYGGTVLDVFVEHGLYGQLRAPLDINTRKKALDFSQDIHSGHASPLKNLTCNLHYHTLEADSEETLDLIEAELSKKGFLTRL